MGDEVLVVESESEARAIVAERKKQQHLKQLEEHVRAWDLLPLVDATTICLRFLCGHFCLVFGVQQGLDYCVTLVLPCTCLCRQVFLL